MCGPRAGGRKLFLINTTLPFAQKESHNQMENSSCPEHQKSVRISSVLFLTFQTSRLASFVFWLPRFVTGRLLLAVCRLPSDARAIPSVSCCCSSLVIVR